ncbi:hypothetical protein C5C18_13760 [Rathayibacter tritici]|nr:hypothetical protein C5C06_12195 [Rathayibacter tritici]PPF63845.1 hypothetical protein C5C21_12785 [Rathayibacter tritici]PPG04386.1 hypothetical protein C5C18_13760 [Rathayibacter tritici]PPI14743.1 hypothetical protein C5D07_08150 [Rathayibacter tritici]PPI43763.1 hypothetical protein C5D18_08360 [Rathayibacter tritici]
MVVTAVWDASSPTPRAVPSIARTPPSVEADTLTDCSTRDAVRGGGAGGVQPASSPVVAASAAPTSVLRILVRTLSTPRFDGAPVAPLSST